MLFIPRARNLTHNLNCQEANNCVSHLVLPCLSFLIVTPTVKSLPFFPVETESFFFFKSWQPWPGSLRPAFPVLVTIVCFQLARMQNCRSCWSLKRLGDKVDLLLPKNLRENLPDPPCGHGTPVMSAEFQSFQSLSFSQLEFDHTPVMQISAHRIKREKRP